MNKQAMVTVLFGCLATLAAACHAPERIVVSGHSVDPRSYRESETTVTKMFAADVACPADPKAVSVLSVDSEEVTELGVSGCNKKRVYVRIREAKSTWGNIREWSPKWILSTKTTGEPATF